jgi:prepilin-type N-terminal cleavage/methylation domain-containing protein
VSSRGPLFAAPLKTSRMAARHRSQAGFTLIELIIASTIGLLVMGALTSVVLTMTLGDNTATGRIEASAQIRNFQLTAYDDFALSRPPNPIGCGTRSSPCTTQEMILMGSRMPNDVGSVATPFTGRYTWDASQQTVTRFVDTTSRVAASSVTAYSWYLDSSGEHTVVVINLTVTIVFYNTTYSESQSLLFYPRVTS